MSKQRPSTAGRFLWDDESSQRSGTSSQRPGMGTRGFSTRDFAVDQSVNLMDIGGDQPSVKKEPKSLRTSIIGMFSRNEAGASERDFGEYGDAAPMADSEEYLATDKKRRLSPLWAAFKGFCATTSCGARLSFLAVIVGIFLLCYGLIVLMHEHSWYRARSIQKTIVESNITPQEVFDAPGANPQKQALDWIASKDSSRLKSDHEAMLERYILAVFYFSSEPSQWGKTDGWLTDAGHCSWYGVQCIPRDDETEDSGISKTYDDSDHVTTLNLSSNGLSGTIPPELGKLSNTLTLDLSDNRISGALPDFHPNLRYLSVRKNSLAGEIPTSITKLTNLHGLDLSKNRFEGTVSADVGKLEELRYLMLSRNRLSGPFPNIEKLIKMTKLHFDDNSFTGALPTYLREFERLAELRVGKNKLGGAFPTQILEVMINLEVLSMGSNEFTGTIPNIFDHIHRLTELHLNNNKLKGTIPDTVGHLSGLTSLHLGSNQLTGTIPNILSIMADVEAIALNDNQFSGKIPSFLGFLDDIRYLNLKGNQFTGTIPTELGGCFRLTDLHLQHNKLTGQIPSQLGKLELLSKFSLEKNDFSAITMPQEVCDLVSVGDMAALSADCKNSEQVSCSCCHVCFPLA